MRCTVPTDKMTAVNNEQLPVENGQIRVLKTRFGDIVIDLEKFVHFPYGLLGISSTKYCLANFPNQSFEYFKILQSIENNDLAFLIYPLAAEGDGSNYNLIAKEDIISCSNELDIPLNKMLIMLITSIYQIPNPLVGSVDVTITANLRAPLIIDTRSNLGVQYVFVNDKYSVRHVIFGDK